MKYLFIILILLVFSCEKYQEHCWACEYLRLNSETGDTIKYIPFDEHKGKCDMTEDQIKAWIQQEEDTKFYVCPRDTTWVTNKVHCILLTCPEY